MQDYRSAEGVYKREVPIKDNCLNTRNGKGSVVKKVNIFSWDALNSNDSDTASLTHRSALEFLVQLHDARAAAKQPSNVLLANMFLHKEGFLEKIYTLNIDNMEGLNCDKVGCSKDDVVIQMHGTICKVLCVTSACKIGAQPVQSEYVEEMRKGKFPTCQGCVRKPQTGRRKSDLVGVTLPSIYFTEKPFENRTFALNSDILRPCNCKYYRGTQKGAGQVYAGDGKFLPLNAQGTTASNIDAKNLVNDFGKKVKKLNGISMWVSNEMPKSEIHENFSKENIFIGDAQVIMHHFHRILQEEMMKK